MTLDCTSSDPTRPIAERLADYLDCHAQALGQSGFEHLSGGWIGPSFLGGCLTIYVALIGYRLVLGRPFGPRQALLSALRAGVVITFASSWSSYETVVYRVLITGPAEVAGQALSRSDVSAPSLSETAQRLDGGYARLRPPAPTGTAASTASTAPAAASGPSGGPQTPAQPQTSVVSTHEAAGLALMISALGGLAAVRLAAGVLLAAGPLFITLALFDTTLGVFEGWVRALVGTFLGAVGATLVAALEIDFFESQLVQAGPDAPDQFALGDSGLLMIALVFGAGMAGVLITCALVGQGFRLPAALRAGLTSRGQPDSSQRSAAAAHNSRAQASPDPVVRARSVADAVRRLGQRERSLSLGSAPHRTVRIHDRFGQAAPVDRSAAAQLSGHAPRRRSNRARTASTDRRDGQK